MTGLDWSELSVACEWVVSGLKVGVRGLSVSCEWFVSGFGLGCEWVVGERLPSPLLLASEHHYLRYLSMQTGLGCPRWYFTRWKIADSMNMYKSINWVKLTYRGRWF